VVALRFGLQLAMLSEAHEPMTPESPILCPTCMHVVPDMTFCPACGVASHASSRTSREARRRDRPRPSQETVQG
jgi:rRNA maturation endonuclease Nob1